ncbi:MAG: T9SS type A sorting domain-containing protein [Bacteroidales bacterium]|nr:T9SS type A sorting domain-containing protein [Bacteroidales bacterium]
MKKIIFMIFIGGWVLSHSQIQPIPNGDFEQWIDYSLEYPTGYPFHSNSYEIVFALPPVSMKKVTDAYHGNFALKLTTVSYQAQDTIFGYAINVRPNDNPNTWKGGFPISGTPTGIKGYYKASLNGDQALILVQFCKTGNVIATYPFLISSSASTYTQFSFSFNPPLPTSPDTVQIGFASTNPFSGTPQVGSWIILDSISFTGISTQPSQLNGSFENWTTEIYSKIIDWNILGHPLSVNKSTDAYQGNYALHLKNFLQEDDSISIKGIIGTGKWVFDGFSWNLVGCRPYNRPYDTLVFAYKYYPSHDDTAQINIVFKKTGNQWPTYWININLTDTGVYTVVEEPFLIANAPDSLCIFISSSIDSHDSLIYVGSELFVDKLYLKSKPLVSLPDFALQKNIRLYPNPCQEFLTIEASQPIRTITILNAEGKILYSEAVHDVRFDGSISTLPPGPYQVRIQFDDMIWYKPFIKN